MTQKAQHAIDFALYCTDWYYEPNEDFAEGYSWQDAKRGWLPIGKDKVTYLTCEQLYKRFLKENKS